MFIFFLQLVFLSELVVLKFQLTIQDRLSLAGRLSPLRIFFFLISLMEIMREIYSCTWPFAITTVLFVVILAKYLKDKIKKKNMIKSTHKLPPGRRGWPLIGDSLNWYNAVASSHPPGFVEEQVKRYYLCFP